MTEAVVTALVERGVDAAQARRAVETAASAVLSGRRSLSLADALANDPVVAGALDREALAHALEPSEHLGAAEAFIDQALAHAKLSSDVSRGAP
jgi:adenylosuccinate lyase